MKSLMFDIKLVSFANICGSCNRIETYGLSSRAKILNFIFDF